MYHITRKVIKLCLNFGRPSKKFLTIHIELLSPLSEQTTSVACMLAYMLNVLVQSGNGKFVKQRFSFPKRKSDLLFEEQISRL